MIWTKSGATAMRCAPWTVAKITAKGLNFYEVWRDDQKEMVGRYASFDVAKHAIEQIELAGRA